MLIVNESNWSTEDLTAIVARIVNTPGYRQPYEFGTETLLLFKTSRRKQLKHREAEAAIGFDRHEDYSDTAVVEIRSAPKLKMELLDHMANIGGGNDGDMSAADALIVTKAIAKALGVSSYWNRDFDLSWGKTMPIRRRRGKAEKHPEVIRRRIGAIEEAKDKIRRHMRTELDILDDRIAKLKEKLE